MLLLSALGLATRPFHQEMALSFVLFFLAAIVVDNGFVTRSEAFLAFLRPCGGDEENGLPPLTTPTCST